MTSVSLFAGLAVKDVLERSVLPPFAAEHRWPVEATFEPTNILKDLIEDGARPDVMIGVGQAMKDLAGAGVLATDLLTPLVRSGIGVAVPPSAPRPSIDTLEHLTQAIVSARSVAYSRTGASGVHFAQLLERLDIADTVNARACIVEKGFAAEALLDGRADLAVQQLVELASVPDADIVGPLPPQAQHYVELWVSTAVDPSAEALALRQLLLSPSAAAAYRASGLDVAYPADRQHHRS